MAKNAHDKAYNEAIADVILLCKALKHKAETLEEIDLGGNGINANEAGLTLRGLIFEFEKFKKGSLG